MHLVQLLLPLYDNDDRPIDHSLYATVRNELMERFGGLTAYNRAPAIGLWKDAKAQTSRDDVVVYEVMVEELDSPWWEDYRKQLEGRFGQKSLVVRASEVKRL